MQIKVINEAKTPESSQESSKEKIESEIEIENKKEK